MIPQDILRYIFSFITNTFDIIRLSRTCKLFGALIEPKKLSDAKKLMTLGREYQLTHTSSECVIYWIAMDNLDLFQHYYQSNKSHSGDYLQTACMMGRIQIVKYMLDLGFQNVDDALSMCLSVLSKELALFIIDNYKLDFVNRAMDNAISFNMPEVAAKLFSKYQYDVERFLPLIFLKDSLAILIVFLKNSTRDVIYEYLRKHSCNAGIKRFIADYYSCHQK